MNTIQLALTAIIEFFKSFGPMLAKGVQLIIDFFIIKTLRERAAYQAEQDAREKAVKEQKLREDANVKSFLAITEASWKVRYQQILDFINAGEYDKILLMRREWNNPVVDNILFSLEKTPEYRAALIIQIMQGAK